MSQWEGDHISTQASEACLKSKLQCLVVNVRNEEAEGKHPVFVTKNIFIKPKSFRGMR